MEELDDVKQVEEVVDTSDATVEEEKTEETPVEEATEQEQSTEGDEVTDTEETVEEKPETVAMDEFGVPYRNRYEESKRKYNQLLDTIPEYIDKAIKASAEKYAPKQTEPEYTEEQLDAYARANPEATGWVESKKKELRDKMIETKVQTEIQKIQQQAHAENVKRQSLAYVQATYPDAFVKNEQGQVIGWNAKSSLAQRIAQYCENPAIKNNPEGLVAAAKMAYADLAQANATKTEKTVKKLKAETSKLKKKTLVEGSGGVPTETPSFRKQIDHAKQTGNVQDVKAAMKEILKARGVLEEE